MRFSHANLVCVSALSVVLRASAVAAQPFPVTDELRVNVYTTESQRAPSAAADTNGNFVVVWDSVGQDGNEEGIFARLFAADAAPIAGEFQVNTYTTAVQYMPRVARHGDGNFVVVWVSRGPAAGGQDGSLHGCFGARFDGSGAPVGTEFQINQYTTGRQEHVAVAAAADGGFVVVWEGPVLDGSDCAVIARRFDIDAVPQGDEFVVNSYTTGIQADPQVCRKSDGDFVVVWDGYGDDPSGFGVFGQRLSASATPVGTEFRVNSTSDNAQSSPKISCSPLGGFVVVWEGTYQDEPSSGTAGLIARRFDNDAIALTGEFIVNTYTTGPQFAASVSHDNDGGFVVAWQGAYQDGGTYSIDHTVLTQAFDSVGTKIGNEFQVNTYSSGTQGEPVAVATADRRFVVAWMSDTFSFPFTQDGDDAGVYMRQLALETTTTTTTATTTTTSTSTTTTTSTIPPVQDCGDANEDGEITATDALSALTTAVGAASCPPCRCDVVAPTPQITASDALAILQAAVQARSLTCAQSCV